MAAFCKVCGKKMRNVKRSSLCRDCYDLSCIESIEYMPTPEEIALECAIIQSEWSEAERKQRAGYVKKPYVKPVYTVTLGNNGKPPEDFHNDYDAGSWNQR